MYHSSSSVFVTNKTPSGAKKLHRSIEQESYQTAKMFLRLAGSKLRDSFMTVLHKTPAPSE